MLKRALLDHWFLKLLSLALSGALWIAITNDEAIVDKAVDAPLEFRNVPGDFEIQLEDGKTVEVFLRGPSTLVREISGKDVSVEIDAPGLRVGPNTVPLRPQDVRHPYGVEVVRVTPAQVRIALAPVSRKTWPSP